MVSFLFKMKQKKKEEKLKKRKGKIYNIKKKIKGNNIIFNILTI